MLCFFLLSLPAIARSVAALGTNRSAAYTHAARAPASERTSDDAIVGRQLRLREHRAQDEWRAIQESGELNSSEEEAKKNEIVTPAERSSAEEMITRQPSSVRRSQWQIKFMVCPILNVRQFAMPNAEPPRIGLAQRCMHLRVGTTSGGEDKCSN